MEFEFDAAEFITRLYVFPAIRPGQLIAILAGSVSTFYLGSN